MEQYRDLTAGYKRNEESNYSFGCHASIFGDNRMSQKAYELVNPIRKMELRIRYDLVNRINNLLYEHKDEIRFNFRNDMTIFFNHSRWKVESVVCKPDTKYFNQLNQGRSLMATLEKNGIRQVVNVMGYFSIDEIITLNEMIFRALYPREDNPDVRERINCFH